MKHHTKLSTTFVLTILFSIFAHAQTYDYLGTYNSDGVPDYLTTADTISQTLLDDIAASLPEYFPVPDYNPQYIADSVETDIILDEQADVWVTFVDEGAGYKNILGFYTYDVENPLQAPQIQLPLFFQMSPKAEAEADSMQATKFT